MLKWQHIEYLFGLAALPLLGLLLFVLLKWKKKTKKRIGDPALVQQLVRNFSSLRWGIKAALALTALAAVVVGAANFQRPGAMQNVKRQGVDVMLVLDVSKSMLARDIKPSRLEKAKQLLIRLNDKMESDRIGLVLFAGRAYLQMPLTTDHGAARMYILDAAPDVVPSQGTVIADALKMANTSFNSKERKYKAILLVSDGEDHDPEALNVAKTLANNGVMINTVGIGSPEGSPIVDPVTGELKKDEKGNTVISKLNEVELQQLADVTHGHYLRLDNVDDALITEAQQIEGVEKKSLSDAEFIDYKSYFQWCLGVGLLLLLVEYFLPERRRQRLRTAVCIGVLLTGAALTTRAQNENANIRSGNRLYKQKQLDQSQKQYEEAVRKAPANPTANYNLGNAQFRKNNYADAVNSYNNSAEHSAGDKAMQEKGLYNKGVALIKQQKLQESIDAWKNALKLDANDEDARENLQKALMQLKQQQQQQQQEKNKKDQEKKDKKDEKKDQQEQPQQPKPQPSRLNKQQVEQYLRTLEQKEKDIQDKMNQNKAKAPNQPDKDW